MSAAEKKVLRLQNKVNKLTILLKEEIYTACETMQYKDSSNFSFTIDRLEQFNNELQNFKLLNK
jgi:hypothetical protein